MAIWQITLKKQSASAEMVISDEEQKQIIIREKMAIPIKVLMKIKS